MSTRNGIMPELPAQSQPPEGRKGVHRCGALQINNTERDQRPVNGMWTWCPSCDWVKNEPMVDEGSGYDAKARRTDVAEQTFWCLRCGGDL